MQELDARFDIFQILGVGDVLITRRQPGAASLPPNVEECPPPHLTGSERLDTAEELVAINARARERDG